MLLVRGVCWGEGDPGLEFLGRNESVDGELADMELTVTSFHSMLYKTSKGFMLKNEETEAQQI